MEYMGKLQVRIGLQVGLGGCLRVLGLVRSRWF